MQTDTLKLLFSYVIALVLIVGGLVFLYYTRAEPSVGDIRLAIVGFITAAITYVFQDNANTRGQRSFEAGLNTPTPGANGTVVGPNDNVTVRP